MFLGIRIFIQILLILAYKLLHANIFPFPVLKYHHELLLDIDAASRQPSTFDPVHTTRYKLLPSLLINKWAISYRRSDVLFLILSSADYQSPSSLLAICCIFIVLRTHSAILLIPTGPYLLHISKTHTAYHLDPAPTMSSDDVKTGKLAEFVGNSKIDDSPASIHSVSEQIALESGHPIRYRSCSWQKVCLSCSAHRYVSFIHDR